MTQRKEPSSKMTSSPFCDFRSLGAGVTPAQGGAEPTVGSAFNQVISPSLYILSARVILPIPQCIDRRPKFRTARLHRILERPRLPLVVPAFRTQPLCFFEIFLR